MSMQNTLRGFVEKRLGGFVVWAKHVKTLSDGSRDFASIEINLPVKDDIMRFVIEAKSCYQKPPLGQVLCRMLGEGQADGVSGDMIDQTWIAIRNFIMTKAGLAPVPKEEPAAAPVTERRETLQPADGRVPHVCEPVVFITNPGEAISGMTELAAMVTRVVEPTIADLIIFPPGSEPFHRERVPRREDGQRTSCSWDFGDTAALTEEEFDRRMKAPQSRKRAEKAA